MEQPRVWVWLELFYEPPYPDVGTLSQPKITHAKSQTLLLI